MNAEYTYGAFGELSAQQLVSTEVEQMDCLLEPIMQRVGIVGFVGASDTGKTTFLRNLGIAISAGSSEFVGFKLNPLHRRVVYVSTEDDEQAVSYMLSRQNETLQLPSESFYGLEYIFDTENLLERLDKLLEAKPADLVVVDAFADLYQGALNENNRVRAFLNDYSQLAHRRGCLIIFLHHTGKRTEELMPSKHNTIGSQGFEAKMRLVIELRSDQTNSELKHLCIVKGNYLPAEYKRESFVLRFDSTLLFSATGARMPFEMLKRRSEDDEREYDKFEQARTLRSEGKTLDQIALQLGYKSKTSVINLLKKFSDSVSQS